MTALGWVAVMGVGKPVRIRLAKPYRDGFSWERILLNRVGVSMVLPEFAGHQNTGDLFEVVGATRNTRDGSLKMVLRASSSTR